MARGHQQLRLPGELWRGMIRAAPPVPASGGATHPRVVIAQLREAGLSWNAVARTLNRQGVPTPSGRGSWYGETVNRHANPHAHAAYMRDYRVGVRRRPPRS